MTNNEAINRLIELLDDGVLNIESCEVLENESSTTQEDDDKWHLSKGNWNNSGKYIIPHDEGLEFVVRNSKNRQDTKPKTEKWIRYGSIPSKNWICSECGGLATMGYESFAGYYNYCPNCGAKMEVKE